MWENLGNLLQNVQKFICHFIRYTSCHGFAPDFLFNCPLGLFAQVQWLPDDSLHLITLLKKHVADLCLFLTSASAYCLLQLSIMVLHYSSLCLFANLLWTLLTSSAGSIGVLFNPVSLLCHAKYSAVLVSPSPQDSSTTILLPPVQPTAIYYSSSAMSLVCDFCSCETLEQKMSWNCRDLLEYLISCPFQFFSLNSLKLMWKKDIFISHE